MGSRLRYPGGSMILGRRPRVMGILNVTPDSFSDGGHWMDVEKAVRQGIRMRREGAHIIDVGGESTRPGASSVTVREEIRRVVPVIERLAERDVTVSIDTSKAAVARAAFGAGARILNDVTALRGDPLMGRVAARAEVPVILMHMKGSPRTMQRNPRYRDVVKEVRLFFDRAVRRALSAGVSRDRIIIDPGIGFGKTLEHNLEILRRLEEFKTMGFPMAIGTSRKRFIGAVVRREVGDRLAGTAATVAVAVLRGADIIRVHDVREMGDVVRMTHALKS